MFDSLLDANMSSDDHFIADIPIKVEVKEEKIDSEDDWSEGELVVDLKEETSSFPEVKIEIETTDVQITDPLKKDTEQVTESVELVCQMCTQYRRQLDDLMGDETKLDEFKRVCKKFEEHRADTRTCDEKTFFCSECGRKFFWIKELKRHKVTVHKHFKCKLCPRKFVDETSLRTHQKFKHQVLLVYNCDSCDQAFFKAKDLYQHEKIHLEEKRKQKYAVRCSTCKRGFTSMNQYQSHRCYTYVCYLCKRRFNCDENFESHKCDDLKPYQCEFCKKSFVMAGNLKNHEQRCRLKENNKDQPLECSICNKFYKNLKALITHQRCHSNSKECPVCKKCFASQKMMKLHELSHKAIQCFNLGTLKI